MAHDLVLVVDIKAEGAKLGVRRVEQRELAVGVADEAVRDALRIDRRAGREALLVHVAERSALGGMRRVEAGDRAVGRAQIGMRHEAGVVIGAAGRAVLAYYGADRDRRARRIEDRVVAGRIADEGVMPAI